MFGAWVPPCCLEPLLPLEQGAVDDELMLKIDPQKQAPVVIAVASFVPTSSLFPHFEF